MERPCSTVTKAAQIDAEEHCDTCLYTGVGTCAAVSIYSMKLYLDLPSNTGISREAFRAIRSQKRFLLLFGSAWSLAGCYRMYID